MATEEVCYKSFNCSLNVFLLILSCALGNIKRDDNGVCLGLNIYQFLNVAVIEIK